MGGTFCGFPLIHLRGFPYLLASGRMLQGRSYLAPPAIVDLPVGKMGLLSNKVKRQPGQFLNFDGQVAATLDGALAALAGVWVVFGVRFLGLWIC